MQTAKTHYEQIPVAMVKKIMEQISRETTSASTTPFLLRSTNDWRHLAAMAQQETDSDRLIELVRVLIEKFEEEKSSSARRIAPK